MQRPPHADPRRTLPLDTSGDNSCRVNGPRAPRFKGATLRVAPRKACFPAARLSVGRSQHSVGRASRVVRSSGRGKMCENNNSKEMPEESVRGTRKPSESAGASCCARGFFRRAGKKTIPLSEPLAKANASSSCLRLLRTNTSADTKNKKCTLDLTLTNRRQSEAYQRFCSRGKYYLL